MRLPLPTASLIAAIVSPTLLLLGNHASIAHAQQPTNPASSDKPNIPPPGHSLHGEAFNEGPRQSAVFLPNMGKVHFPVTTSSPEAQRFIDQGVGQLHSFFYLEAERSFRQAAVLDPKCGMAYWGMGMANVNNAKRARGFLKEAAKFKDAMTRREQLYLEGLTAFHGEKGNEKARRKEMIEKLATLAKESPEDLDGRAWLAMLRWQDGPKDLKAREEINAQLGEILQVEPVHPGAHHYRIHLWDGTKPDNAVKSAELYGPAAAGIAHAWHMPGHTYTELKRYPDAAYQQEASARVDHAYMASSRVMPFEIHNYAHNNQWLATTLTHIGRARDAIAVARDLVEQPRDPGKNGKNDGGSAQRSGRLRWVEALTRFELWDDLIASTTSNALDWSDLAAEKRQRAHSLGLAYAGTANGPKLAEQIAALKTMAADEAKQRGGPAAKGEARKSAQAKTEAPKTEAPKTEAAKAAVPPRRSYDSNPQAVSDTEAAIAELEGYQKLAVGEIKAAFERFGQAKSMRPEALALAHLKVRNYGLAEALAKEAVSKNPNQVAALATYVEVLAGAGKVAEAQKQHQQLKILARYADPDLPILRRIARIEKEWTSKQQWVAGTGSSSPGQGSSESMASVVEGARPTKLETLGPLVWSPFSANPFELADTEGRIRRLSDYAGKNVVVLFYLGGKCAHCMQQLQAFGKEIEALRKLNTELIAISTDSPAETLMLKQNADAIKFPMPLLSSPGLEVFKSYRVYDDFEKQAMHGTFLIDSRGKVRYQKISPDPFLDVEFIKTEAERVNRLAK